MASAASSSSTKAMPAGKVILKTAEGDLFEVEKAMMKDWETVNPLIADDRPDLLIPVPNVNSQTLALVIEFCRKHVEFTSSSDASFGMAKENLKKWDDYFDFDEPVIFDIIMAANYLNFKKLFDMACQKVAEMLTGKTTEEIRQKFHITNDYTPEEEEEVRRANSWAFE